MTGVSQFDPELTELLNETLALSPAVIYRIDAKEPHELQYLSPNVNLVLEIDESIAWELEGWAQLMHPDDLAFNYALFNDFLHDPQQTQIHRRYRLKTREGDYIWVSDRSQKVIRDGHFLAIAGALVNVHRQHMQELETLENKRMLAEAQRIARLGHWVSFPQENILQWSDIIFEILGIKKGEFSPTIKGFLKMIHVDDREREQAALKAAYATGKYDVEHRVCCPNGRIVWVHQLGELRILPDGREQLFGTVRDITEAKRLHEELLALSRTDSLTGIYNHRYFVEELKRELVRLQRTGQVFSLIMLDYDYFKQINDSYGHSMGDEVLIAGSAAIQQRVRAMDTFARLGGEEFAVLLPQTTAAEALKVASELQKCIHSLGLCALGQIEPIPVSASFGVLEVCAREITTDEVLNRVDKLMYQAKDKGRDAIVSDTLD